MSKKLQAIILALGLSVMMFGVGCSSDDDEETPTGPTAQERLVGLWDATNPGDITGDNSSYVEFDFTADSTFSLVFAFITGPLDDTTEVAYTGKYHASGDGHMHLTDIEIDGEPSTDTYDWSYSQYADDDSMHVTHTGVVEGTVVGTYVNVTPVTAN
jgi:hypothetical protein